MFSPELLPQECCYYNCVLLEAEKQLILSLFRFAETLPYQLPRPS